MTILHIMRPNGHKDAGDQAVAIEEDVNLARELFAEAQRNGMLVYGVKENGNAEHIPNNVDFDEIVRYPQVTATPRVVGG